VKRLSDKNKGNFIILIILIQVLFSFLRFSG